MPALKTPHFKNFEYLKNLRRGVGQLGSRRLRSRITCFEGEVYRLQLSSSLWRGVPERAVLSPPSERPKARPRLRWAGAASLRLGTASDARLLSGPTQECFGIAGKSWILRLSVQGEVHCFGLGDKWGPLDKSGQRTRFYNTDVWAEFDHAAVQRGDCDPLYGSVPYVALQCGGCFVGVLLDSAYPSFMHLPGQSKAPGSGGAASQAHLELGAMNGAPDLYFLIGPSLSELTRKLQRLVGVTPRPPLWALGYHQSRWGYGGARDLDALDAAFERHRIPCDGLWLDIDYMHDFRVFTLNPQSLPRPAATLQRLSRRGRRVVPIIDPGVKREPGYTVYDEGMQQGHFCQTPAGTAFVGQVWPGDTVFPDFSRSTVRQWWGEKLARFADYGFAGFWLDMNEPATGKVDPETMLFRAGSQSHASYHNHYALGMARASHAGLSGRAPDERPFLVSRAFSPSISRYAAVWTGDNYSNETHLALAITTTLSLALSGVPFNAPDVPGFGGDADEDLAVRWYKTCFLFPFLRNHACTGTRRQEPWVFSKRGFEVIRHYIRLRYKLLPYLYSLFVRQERDGEAILRPLFYDFPAAGERECFRVDDQFMVGPALMQAPLLSRSRPRRQVLLPEATWFEAHSGRWQRGGRRAWAQDAPRVTPLYVREGCVVPMLGGLPQNQHSQLDRVELHVFLRRRSTQTGRLDYEFDDGASYGYRRGACTRVQLSARVLGKKLVVFVERCDEGYRPLWVRLVLYEPFESVLVASAAGEKLYPVRQGRWRFSGEELAVWRTQSFEVSARQ